MNNIDPQYQSLLQDILDNGIRKEDRTGTGTISVFGRQIRHKMSDGFPLLTTKKMYFKGIVTELLWFLRGDTNIKYLVDNDCHIWDGDAYKRYVTFWGDPIDPVSFELYTRLDLHPDKRLYTKDEFIERIKTNDEFARTWGELGPIYGKQWRDWDRCCNLLCSKHKPIDQIANLINDLKTNPDSRRLMVNAWNVGELDRMVLPPCHFSFQCYSHEKEGKRYLSLAWNQRSVDTFLGLPFNISSYGLLLEIIAKEVNMVPDELIGNLGDVHLYSNHVEQAKEQIGRELTLEERIKLNGFINETEILNLLPSNIDYIMKKLDENAIPKHTRKPFPLPKLNIFEPAIGKTISIIDNLNIWEPSCFIIENYQSHPSIKAPLSN